LENKSHSFEDNDGLLGKQFCKVDCIGRKENKLMLIHSQEEAAKRRPDHQVLNTKLPQTNTITHAQPSQSK